MTTRVVFMGSAGLACPSLRALAVLPDFSVAGVVTQPDRPKGRALALAPSPVNVVARALGIPVLAPEKVNTPESLAALAAWQPDVIAVVAYGQILRAPLLGLPPRGCINLHASLLPKYRGAAPIQWAIATGERETGVTTMLMNAQMDAGDMLLTETVAIAADDTAGTLGARLAEVGAALLARTLPAWVAGTLAPQAQDPARVTFAPKLRKQDGEIDWTLRAEEIHNRVRGFNPWPGCTCNLPADGETGAEALHLKVHRVAVEPGAGKPGTVLAADGLGPLIACGQGALRLVEVQPPGRKAMGGDAYLRGRALRVGTRLG